MFGLLYCLGLLQKNTFVNNRVFCTVLFVLLFAMSYLDFTNRTSLFHFLCRAFLATSFFMLLYSFKTILQKSRLLNLIGRYSFQVYLIHIFVYVFLYKVFPHGTELERIDIGVILFVITTVISVIIAVVLMKVPLVVKIIFPK